MIQGKTIQNMLKEHNYMDSVGTCKTQPTNRILK